MKAILEVVKVIICVVLFRISRGKVGVSKMQVEMKGPNIVKI